MSRRCIFFDRDGIVNRHPNNRWISSWADFRWMPGFMESLRLALQKGYVAAVVTNQQGIGKGVHSAAEIEALHAQLMAQLRRWDLPILGVYTCPHIAAAACACRKPEPGLLLEAARAHDLDLEASWMVGDQERDILAGHAAGCRTVRVHASLQTRASARVDSMEQLPALLDKIL